MSIYSLANGIKRVDVPQNHAKNNLPIGTVCLFVGYGDHKYVIVGNAGVPESFPEYGAAYTLVNVDTFSTQKTNAMSLRPIAEKFGIGIYLLDEPVRSADEVLDLIEKAAQAGKQAKEAATVKAQDKQARLEALPGLYPYLVLLQGSGRSAHAVGAGNIKRELARVFPAVKFHVKSQSYSGGNSISVGWTDGPSSEAVDKVIGKYEEGSFDGMTDSYTYDHDRVWPDVFGGAKYVSPSRNCSAGAFDKVAAEMGYPQARMNDKTGQMDGVEYDINTLIKRETWKRGF